MSRLVKTNQLVLRQSMTGGESMESVDTFDDLPATEAADVPIWVADRGQPSWYHATVDAFPVHEWLSERWVQYLVNNVAELSRLNFTAGDTIADLLARGYTAPVTGGSSVTDGTNGIRLTSTGGNFVNSSLSFENLQLPSGTNVLTLQRSSQLQGSNSPGPGFAGYFILVGPTHHLRTTWNDANVQNQVSFYRFSGSNARAGIGGRNITGFDPVECKYFGFATGDSLVGASPGRSAAADPIDGDFFSINQVDAAIGSPRAQWNNQNGTGDTSIIEVAASHVFEILRAAP